LRQAFSEKRSKVLKASFQVLKASFKVLKDLLIALLDANFNL
jgi:hypothetical protein